MTIGTETSTPQQTGDATELTGSSLIGNRAVRGSAGAISAIDPATGTTLEPSYGLVGGAEVDEAAELAWVAFSSYRRTSPAARAAFLDTIADNIAALGSVLTDRVMAETGLPLARVQGETARTTGQLRLFAELLRRGTAVGARLDPARPERTPLPRADIRQRRISVGPVAVFGASNFPLAFSVAGGDTASALAAGAPVVVKAHSAHPGTSELVGRAIAAAVAEHDLHPGVFSLLFGGGASAGIALVSHPRIKAVGFTGSRTAGMALVEAAAARPEPIPVFAEMSSVNPVFILPGALVAKAAELGAAWVASVSTGNGQLCTSPGLVFVPRSELADVFTAAAGAAVRDVAAGPMLTGGIRDAFQGGARVLADHPEVTELGHGTPAPAVVVGGVPQLFVTDAHTFLTDQSLQDEIFGPASLVVTVDDTAQMAEILAGLEGQLTVTIHSDGAEAGAQALLDAAELRAGRVLFNGWPTGVEVGHAMVHGGPFPATSNGQTTSVGSLAIDRFLRPVSYQNVPAELLPAELQDANPLGLWRLRDGELTRAGEEA
jgi:alpha-ketoglutaric semialdehyde dehydrogenase